MTSTALDLNHNTAPAPLEIRPGQQGWTEQQQAALSVLGIKGASKADLDVFFHYCQRTGLDPFSRQIYGIMRREKVVRYERGQKTEEWADKFTIQVGIDGFRIIRDRACRRDNIEVEYEDTWWYDDAGQPYKVWLWEAPPAACSFAVLKNGRRYPAVLTFREYVQRDRAGNVSGLWKTAPAHQLEKCTEAYALRRAFPHDLGGVRLEDEPVQAPADTDSGETPAASRPRGRVTAAEVLERQQPARRAPAPARAKPGDDDAPWPDDAAPARRRAARPVADVPLPPQDPPAAAAAEPGPAAPARPEPALPAQLSEIGRHLSRLGYTDADDAERHHIMSRLAGRGITDSRQLTRDEAQQVARGLKPCKTKGDVIALLADGEKPGEPS
jgi:phage recombination protein Bet